MVDFARPFSLAPPPLDRQFACEKARARKVRRISSRRLEKALDIRASLNAAGEPNAGDVAAPEYSGMASSFDFRLKPSVKPAVRVSPSEFARVWGGLSTLWINLEEDQQVRLRVYLRAYLEGELGPAGWRAIVQSISEARRALDPAVGARVTKAKDRVVRPAQGWCGGKGNSAIQTRSDLLKNLSAS